MNKLFTKIAGLSIGLAMAIGVGVAVGSNKEAIPVRAATDIRTWDLVTDASTLAANDIVTFVSNTTTKYVTQNVANATGSGSYLLRDSTSVTISNNTISGLDAITHGFVLEGSSTAWKFKSLSESSDFGGKYLYKTTTKNTMGADASSTATGTGWTISISNNIATITSTNKKTYTIKYNSNSGQERFSTYTANQNTIYLYKARSSNVAASINGADSVDVNSTWTPTSITEDLSGNTVTGVTFAFATSGGATISNQSTSTGSFKATAAGTNGKVTVSATKTGYTITSKVVTVNSAGPYINLTLNSGASAYTGQNVSISASYGNGVAGLNWSVQSGSVTSPSGTNSGYTAKIAGSTGTLTIRATDTGSALYSEVSVSVAKTAFDTSPAATATVAEGKTTTLSAALNSGGTINWESDDTSVATVTATGGSVTVTGVAEGTATIKATSADDTSVYAECDVTVTEAPSEVVITKSNVDGISTSYAEHDWTYGTGTSVISGKIQASYNGDDLQLNKKQGSWVYNTDAIKGYITGITCVKVSGTTDLTCWAGTSVMSSDPASGGTSNQTYSWTFDPNDHYTYFRISATGSEGARKVSSITISYQKVQTVDPTGIHLDDSSTINMDTYGYGRRRLTATVEPFNANDKTVTWGTSDASVVTVANGVLTAVGVGTTTVYATTVNYISDVATPDLKASVTVNVTEALYRKATFVPTSTSAATQTDDYLPGGSVSLSASSAGTWNTDKSAIQLSGGKDVTFTISGYAGMKISGVDLIVSSNASAGKGALSVTAGTTNIFTISSATFDDPTWNGAYDANPCDLYRATTEYVVDSEETVKFSFSATVNSLYVHSVAIRYLDYSLEQWCENFLEQITCSGGTPGSITDDSNWDDLGIAFLELDESLRSIAASATANKDSESVIEQAMARYDLIIRKYGIGTGSGQHDDFIGRFGVGTVNGPLNSYKMLLSGSSTVTTIVVIVISSIAAVAIGGYFLFRKKKED